ncbi:hypothetical protein CSOJ01_09876 [Colletotrichum sojae]|uniref:Uncharacterized protein n=1 Tax=Colletotrichum sojae TaxID=2175907 RepID=A0A8H6J1R4_9PEZI|nr:hypothetical protein CSOJ01_09876 [Colletotrichum sojae]
MAETDSFRPNNTITHRYEDAKVLQAELVRLKFDKKDIEIRADNGRGFRIQLPRQLDEYTKTRGWHPSKPTAVGVKITYRRDCSLQFQFEMGLRFAKKSPPPPDFAFAEEIVFLNWQKSRIVEVIVFFRSSRVTECLDPGPAVDGPYDEFEKYASETPDIPVEPNLRVLQLSLGRSIRPTADRLGHVESPIRTKFSRISKVCQSQGESVFVFETKDVLWLDILMQLWLFCGIVLLEDGVMTVDFG